MRGSEKLFWTHLRDKLKGVRCHLQRHEDRYAVGVPDVSYALDGTHGWIELKALREWPKRTTTPVRVGLTAEQAAWLRQRAVHGGGSCWIFLRVGQGAKSAFLLFSWTEAGTLVDAATSCGQPLTRERVYDKVVWRCEGRLDVDGLCRVLRAP